MAEPSAFWQGHKIHHFFSVLLLEAQDVLENRINYHVMSKMYIETLNILQCRTFIPLLVSGVGAGGKRCYA